MVIYYINLKKLCNVLFEKSYSIIWEDLEKPKNQPMEVYIMDQSINQRVYFSKSTNR